MTNHTTIPSEQMDNTVSDEQFDALVKKHAQSVSSGSQLEWDVCEFNIFGLKQFARALLALKAEQPAPFQLPPVRVTSNIGMWLSAALEDPMACDEFKADIEAWFKAGEPGWVKQPVAQGDPLSEQWHEFAYLAARSYTNKGDKETPTTCFIAGAMWQAAHPSPASQVPEGLRGLFEGHIEQAYELTNAIAIRQRQVGDTIEPVHTIKHAQKLAKEAKRRISLALDILSASPKPPEPQKLKRRVPTSGPELLTMYDGIRQSLRRFDAGTYSPEQMVDAILMFLPPPEPPEPPAAPKDQTP